VFPVSLPRVHSYTWSDNDGEGAAQSQGERTALNDPLGLKDKELHLWVTYPDREKKRAKRKRKGGKPRRGKRHLWAVVIIEVLKKEDLFSYEVTLRRIYKKDERLIKVTVRNDPADQSDDATVFSIVSPPVKRLDALEQQLSMWAAKRVYDAIAETWSGVHSHV
jgi:hypothetical protein